MTCQRPRTKRRRNQCSSVTSTRRSTRLHREKSWYCSSVLVSATDTSTPWPRSASSCRSAVNASGRSRTRRCKSCGGSMVTASTPITRSSSARPSPEMSHALSTRLLVVVRPRGPQHHPPLLDGGIGEDTCAAVRVLSEEVLGLRHICHVVDDQHPGLVFPRPGHHDLAHIKQGS